MSKEDNKMKSVLTENRIFDPVEVSPEYAKTGMSMDEYKKLYKQSIEDMEGFWGEQAKSLDWFKPYDKVWEKTDLFPGKWFVGGKLNVSYNCLDRHVNAGNGDRVAIIWEADEPGQVRKFTYNELLKEVIKVANAMRSKGLKKGDRVTIWLPMIPELAIIMLACARIGVIHSIVFGGFSKEAVKDRIEDSDSRLLFTSDETLRAGKTYPKMADVVKIIHKVPTMLSYVFWRLHGLLTIFLWLHLPTMPRIQLNHWKSLLYQSLIYLSFLLQRRTPQKTALHSLPF